jgi:hypothetical protein
VVVLAEDMDRVAVMGQAAALVEDMEEDNSRV